MGSEKCLYISLVKLTVKSEITSTKWLLLVDIQCQRIYDWNGLVRLLRMKRWLIHFGWQCFRIIHRWSIWMCWFWVYNSFLGSLNSDLNIINVNTENIVWLILHYQYLFSYSRAPKKNYRLIINTFKLTLFQSFNLFKDTVNQSALAIISFSEHSRWDSFFLPAITISLMLVHFPLIVLLKR